jgi:hypothetical protein
MSPAGASMYCSPHPAALHIAPAARLRGFCLYDSASGSFITTNLFILPDLHFVSAVLLVFLRQDESLDSPCLARSAKADAIMPFNPIMGQAILPVYVLN